MRRPFAFSSFQIEGNQRITDETIIALSPA
jgi:hypothetical protein